MIIKVTPAELKNQANLVRDDIKEVKTQWDLIAETIKESKQYWEGDASKAHIRIYDDIKDDVVKSIKKLKENPKKLLAMAGIYEETEMEVEADAEQLPSDLF